MIEKEIQQRIESTRFGKTIVHRASLPSTNTHAKSLAMGGAGEGTVVIADDQTEGRGRLGRTWYAEPGKNLTFSLIITPNIPPDRTGIVSLFASAAVASAIKNISSLQPDCKWPNDVLINGKKCCGILSEITSSGKEHAFIVIGIGVNINQTIFPPEFAPYATSLCLEAGRELDRFIVLAEILEQMETMYPAIIEHRFGEIVDRWTQSSTMPGREITIDRNGDILRGTAARLDGDGGLIVATHHGEVKVLAGDVTLHSTYSTSP